MHNVLCAAARIPATDGYLDLASGNYVFRNTYGDTTPNVNGFVYAAVAADLPVATWTPGVRSTQSGLAAVIEHFGCAVFGDYDNGARPRRVQAASRATCVRRRLCRHAFVERPVRRVHRR